MQSQQHKYIQSGFPIFEIIDHNNSYQVYCTDDGSCHVKDLMEPAFVNQRMKEVILGPIQDYINY